MIPYGFYGFKNSRICSSSNIWPIYDFSKILPLCCHLQIMHMDGVWHTQAVSDNSVIQCQAVLFDWEAAVNSQGAAFSSQGAADSSQFLDPAMAITCYPIIRFIWFFHQMSYNCVGHNHTKFYQIWSNFFVYFDTV